MMQNKRRNSMVYRSAFSFFVMSFLAMLGLSTVSYLFLSAQYTKNIKTALVSQFQVMQTELEYNKWLLLEEELPANQGFVFFVQEKWTPLIYLGTKIPFAEHSFYDSELGGEHPLFYMDLVGGKEVFLGKTTEDFHRTRIDYVFILLGINVLFLVLLIGLSVLISRKNLAPLTQLAERLLAYKFDNPSVDKFSYAGEYFEIGILTKSLDKALDRVRLSLQREKEFLQDASHELRTPLMGISTSLELLQETSLSPEQKKKVEGLQILANKLQNIADDLLFLTRTAADGCNKISVNLSVFLQSLVAEYQGRIDKKKLQLKLDLDKAFLIVACDLQMQKLFSNLIDNAIKYTPEGGKITITLKDWIFVIQDTGIGMSKEFISKIWERFHRDEHAAKYNYEGVWLWLAIVCKVVEICGWKLEVESELEKGTKISILFHSHTLS